MVTVIVRFFLTLFSVIWYEISKQTVTKISSDRVGNIRNHSMTLHRGGSIDWKKSYFLNFHNLMFHVVRTIHFFHPREIKPYTSRGSTHYAGSVTSIERGNSRDRRYCLNHMFHAIGYAIQWYLAQLVNYS